MSALDELRARYREFMLGKTNDSTVKKEALERNDLGTQRDALRDGNVRVFGQTPAGKHAMRGIPLMPVGGTQPGSDPLQALLDKEAGRTEKEND